MTLVVLDIVAAALDIGQFAVERTWIALHTLLTLALLAILALLAVVAFSRKPSPIDQRRRIPRFANLYRKARYALLGVSLVFLAFVGPTSIATFAQRHRFTIVVAEITGGEESRQINGHLQTLLESLQAQYPNVKLTMLPSDIGSITQACQTGKRAHADVVVWGSFDMTASNANALLQDVLVENCTSGPPPTPDYFCFDASTQEVDVPMLRATVLQQYAAAIHYFVARDLYHAGDLDQAIQASSDSIASFGLAAPPYLLRAQALVLRDIDQMYEDYYEETAPGPERILSSDPSQQGPFIHHNQIVDDLDTAIRLAPDLAQALYLRGTLYLREGRYLDSVDLLTRCLAIDQTNPDPPDADIYLMRGLAYSELAGGDQQAIEDLTAAIRLRPDDPFLHWNRGAIYLEEGDTTQATEDFSVVFRLARQQGLLDLANDASAVLETLR